MNSLPRFFRLRQKFDRPKVSDLGLAVSKAVSQARLVQRIKPGDQVAITAGSRGIANIALILKHIVAQVKSFGGQPFLVPAMGSHGGATAEGQVGVLKSLGVTPEFVGCEIRSSMETKILCEATEGFPVHFDAHAMQADHVVVVNRVKPHTRFFGNVESGLMKMMLIGLGKHQGALVYHRVIQNYTFNQIVASVAKEVIARCPIAAGIAILENGYEETADIVGLPPESIIDGEPGLLERVKKLLPKLPFDHAELLIIDRIGKDISGSGMDTNVVGRKSNDSAALGDETPKIQHIYLRGLTESTHGNAAGIGIAEMCHSRLLQQMDARKTRINCITASHIAGAKIPVDFPNDREAIENAIAMSGWGKIEDYTAMWIPDTLHLEEVECSEVFWPSLDGERMAKLKTMANPITGDNPLVIDERCELISDLRPLAFDSHADLVERFEHGAHVVA